MVCQSDVSCWICAVLIKGITHCVHFYNVGARCAFGVGGAGTRALEIPSSDFEQTNQIVFHSQSNFIIFTITLSFILIC